MIYTINAATVVLINVITIRNVMKKTIINADVIAARCSSACGPWGEIAVTGSHYSTRLSAANILVRCNFLQRKTNTRKGKNKTSCLVCNIKLDQCHVAAVTQHCTFHLTIAHLLVYWLSIYFHYSLNIVLINHSHR